jgi:hypothetical protein
VKIQVYVVFVKIKKIMKKLLKERFQKLAGIKPLYINEQVFDGDESGCYGNAEIIFNGKGGCTGGIDHSEYFDIGFLTWPEMCPYTGGPVYYTNAPDDWGADQLSNPPNYFNSIMNGLSDGSSICSCYEELCSPNDDFLGSQTQIITKPDAMKDPGNKYPGKGKPMNKTQSRTNRNINKPKR